MKINRTLLAHSLFFIGYLTAFWGAFEMACQSPNHSMWSGTWGFPIFHHYIWGFIGVLVAYFLLTKNDWDITREMFISDLLELKGQIDELVKEETKRRRRNS